MPDATITSTASTFGTISGTFAADQSTVTGTVTAIIPGTLSGSVGVPGPQGPAGPGLPAGGTEGQIIVKASATDYDTVWTDNSAETLTAIVRNETGATLTKGTVVYITGAAGNKALVSKASASSEATSSKTFAILAADILNNQNGTAVTVGLLKNLNTIGLTEGGSLWLSTTAGEWTQTMPTAPNHAVFLGTVTRVHANQGTVEVRIQNGYELQELHNVKITSLSNGQVLKYDAAQSLWVNATDAVGAVTSVAGRTGAVVLSNTDISGLGTMATATATDYLSKAGNLSGLANVTTARNNLGLGAANNVTFNAVGRITGGNLSGETTRAYSLGINSDFGGNLTLSKYLYTDDGGDPAIVYVSDYKQADYTSSGIVIKNTTLDVSGVEQDGYRFRIGGEVNSGIYATRWTAGVPDGYTITPDQLLLNSAGNGYFSIEPATGITFPDSTVQTTAAFNFDPTGYATELWVTSQGYLVSGDLTGYATESWVTSQGYLTSAPVTSVAGKTGAVTLAVADVSGAAPTDSPTFTGTPSLPTGTTAVTQAAGNNTTAVATTAFVQQEVPDFATLAEARTNTNTTTVLSPNLSIWQKMSAAFLEILRGTHTYTAVGTMGTAQNATLGSRFVLGTAGACSGRLRVFGASQNDQSFSMMSKATVYGINFSKPVYCSGRAWPDSTITDPNVTVGWYFGKSEANGAGDLSRRGFGWEIIGNASTRYLTLVVHDGTTLTKVTSSYVVVTSTQTIFDWDVVSDGAGNVTLYVDGAQVATTALGPTGDTNYSGTRPVIWQEELRTTAATSAFSFVFGRGRIYMVL